MPGENTLVQRLIAFLKKPGSLDYDGESPVHNPYDDYTSQDITHPPGAVAQPGKPDDHLVAYDGPIEDNGGQVPGQASRLDALIMRAVQQFEAQQGYVIRSEADGQMRYCTGRDLQGRHVLATDVNLDRRALFLALDSGESQLFVHTLPDETPAPVLCGPLWIEDEVIGVLYLDNPARSRLHRGVFDVFCNQAARMLAESGG
ncbi:MAG: GAF domain-containing protein [Anaerolineae bacterium]|nr:GAF domain-containing protein [Anaerolineae bacterium]